MNFALKMCFKLRWTVHCTWCACCVQNSVTKPRWQQTYSVV